MISVKNFKTKANLYHFPTDEPYLPLVNKARLMVILPCQKCNIVQLLWLRIIKWSHYCCYLHEYYRDCVIRGYGQDCHRALRPPVGVWQRPISKSDGGERERRGRMRMGGVSGARQRQERSEHHTHKVLSRSQTCRAHRSRPSSLQGLLPEVFRWTRTSVHARWIVLLLHLVGLLEIWEVAVLRTRASAHRDSLDVRIKTPCGSVRAVARGTWIKRICAPSRFPEEWNILQAILAAHMAFPNSPGSPGGGKPNPSVIDLGTILVDSDIIFGFTSHLLKRKTKVRMFYLDGCDASFLPIARLLRIFCADLMGNGDSWWWRPLSGI